MLENVPSTNGYRPGFANPLMLKDLSLAVNAAQSVGLELELGPATQELYTRMVNEGMGKLDFSSALAYILKKHPQANISVSEDNIKIHEPPVKNA